jgi:hypothetical protein
MQRLAVSLSAFALIFVVIINGALFFQNSQLRKQIVSAQHQAALAAPSPDLTAKIDELEKQLDRSDQDRVKATRDATAARSQLATLAAAAGERDALIGEVDALRQENAQLRQEVGNLQTMNTINSQVVPLRGLAPGAAVPRTFMNHDQLRAHFTTELERELPPEAEQRQRAILRALDMDSGAPSLRQAQIDDAVSSILGFYDHNSKQLVVVSDRPQMGAVDRATYAHEFTHSLQDQHYDLAKLFARADDNADYANAIRALVEGDATLTMGLYAREYFTDVDIANYQLEQFQSIDLAGLQFGGPLVESAASFPYQDGTSFVAGLYQLGGWEAVDAAFAHPPRSTEQVLHPERYLAADEPVAVRLPVLGPGGWRVLDEDTLGELYLRIYLEHGLSIDRAIAACEGWGGDRYQVLTNEQGQLALVLRTAWDDQAAATRFFDAAATYANAIGGGDAALVEADQSHLRWQMAGRQFFLGRTGGEVLLLHAPDGATIDALLAQLKGF